MKPTGIPYIASTVTLLHSSVFIHSSTCPAGLAFSDMIGKGYISVIASKIRISKENFMPKKEI